MRVLFLPLITRGPAVGTITRCLSIADHLRMSGHEACFLTNGEGAKHVVEAGFPYQEGLLPDPPGSLHPLYDLADVAVFLNLTKEEFLRGSLDAEQRAIDAFKPDALFSEFKLTAAITAAANGLPLISTACTAADFRFVSPLFPEGRVLDHEEAISGFNRILAERKLEPVKDVSELFFMRSDLKIAPTVPEIEPLLEDVPNLHYCGYLLYDRWEFAPLPAGLLEQAQGRNIVFAYLGMGEIGPSEYVRVLPDAYDGTEWHAVVAVGDHPDLPELPSATPNVTWVRFVPGRSMMRCSKALIFHGGQNTAMASLIHKLPSLMFPGQDFERDFNARALARIGAGLRMRVEDFTPERLLGATREIQRSSYKLATKNYGRKVQGQGGPRYAAGLVDQIGGPINE